MIGGQALRLGKQGLGEGDEGQEKSTLQIDDERGGGGRGRRVVQKSNYNK